MTWMDWYDTAVTNRKDKTYGYAIDEFVSIATPDLFDRWMRQADKVTLRLSGSVWCGPGDPARLFLIETS